MDQYLSDVHQYKVQIREAHLDTFGHMNNASYLVLLEQARWELIAERGFGLKEIQEKQLGPTILSIGIQFRREIKNREWITIHTGVTEVAGKVATLKQTMVNEKGEEACIAEFKFGLFDMRARKLIEPTPDWKFALGLK